MGVDMKHIKLIGAVFVIATAMPVAAWNDRGHMVVAAVAWEEMTPQTREKVHALLKLNPQYRDWIKGVPPEVHGKYAIMRAATWPDYYVRKNYVDEGYDPVEPVASQNKGYADRYVHRYWHFKDLPYETDGVSGEQPPNVNAVSRIETFSAALGNRQLSDDIRSYDLTWLLHLVGDIHQPLHATARYNASFRRGDNGGNGVKLCTGRDCVLKCSDDKAQSLHSFWDGAIGASKSVGRAVQYQVTLTGAGMPAPAMNAPDDWASESRQLAIDKAYAGPVGPKCGPHRVTAGYRNSAADIANRRIFMAGYRLAKLLDTNLQ